MPQSLNMPRWSHIVAIVHEVAHHIHMHFSGWGRQPAHGKEFMDIEQKLFDVLLDAQRKREVK